MIHRMNQTYKIPMKVVLALRSQPSFKTMILTIQMNLPTKMVMNLLKKSVQLMMKSPTI